MDSLERMFKRIYKDVKKLLKLIVALVLLEVILLVIIQNFSNNEDMDKVWDAVKEVRWDRGSENATDRNW